LLSLSAGVSDVQGSASPAHLSTTNLASLLAPPMAATYTALASQPRSGVTTFALLSLSAGVSDVQGGASPAYLSATNPASLLAPPMAAASTVLLMQPRSDITISACCHCLQVSVTHRAVHHLLTSAPPTLPHCSRHPWQQQQAACAAQSCQRCKHRTMPWQKTQCGTVRGCLPIMLSFVARLVLARVGCSGKEHCWQVSTVAPRQSINMERLTAAVLFCAIIYLEVQQPAIQQYPVDLLLCCRSTGFLRQASLVCLRKSQLHCQMGSACQPQLLAIPYVL
jgi:hypothetical protein